MDSLAWALLVDDADAGLSCEGFEGQLLAWAGGATRGGAALAALHHHAATCADCRESLLAARAALAALDPALPSPVDAARLPAPDLAFLREAPAAPTAPRAWPAWRWAAALLLLAFVLLRAAVNGTPRGVLGPGAEGGPSATASLPAAASEASGRRASPSTSPAAQAAAEPTIVARAAIPSATAATAPTQRPGATSARLARAASPVAPQPPTPAPTVAPAAPPEPEEPGQGDEPDPPPATPLPSPWPEPAQALCAVQGFGPDTGLFDPSCGPFRNAAAFDLFRVRVSIGGLWRFDTCENSGGLDTVLALYPAGGFDPAAPCQNLLAAADEGCGAQAVLALDLPPGDYLLLLSEQSGDLSAPYRLGVSGPAGQDVCPRVLTPEPPASPVAPTRTANPGTPAAPLPTADPATPQHLEPPVPEPTGIGVPGTPTAAAAPPR